MERIKALLISVVIVTISTGCTCTQHSPHKKPVPTPVKAYVQKPSPQKLTQRTYTSPCFDNIVISGRINALIKKGRKTSVTLTGDPKIINQNICGYKGRTVYIKAPSDSNYAVNATITAPTLKTLSLENGAYVKTANLSVGSLSLAVNSHYNVTLNGQIFAEQTQVLQRGKGKITIAWLDSDRITVQSSNRGIVWLAGNVSELRAKLSDSAYLDSKYLRSDNIIIQTKNHAYAAVTPLNQIQAFTEDKSNVFYYARPKKIVVTSQDSSNVLYISSNKNY